MRKTAADTRAAILAAARERFATDGYERATIRAIAADAVIDPSMVMRYFGSKEQLFAAASDLDLELPDLAGVPLRKLGAVLAAHFLDRWETDEGLKVLLRTALSNDVAAARMKTIFATQLTQWISKVAANPREAALRAGLVATQVLGMAFCRYLLQLPPVAAMTRAEVVAWLAPTLQRYVAGPAAARQPGSRTDRRSLSRYQAR
ncbi:MAG: TetR family transcriptional regulator [Chloroflexi bacterium]|nr:TetR family transcriptional regulator [Chloroflexota bacterium]